MMHLLFADVIVANVSAILLSVSYIAIHLLLRVKRKEKRYYPSFEMNYFEDCVIYAIPLIAFCFIVPLSSIGLIIITVGGLIVIFGPVLIIALFD